MNIFRRKKDELNINARKVYSEEKQKKKLYLKKAPQMQPQRKFKVRKKQRCKCFKAM